MRTRERVKVEESESERERGGKGERLERDRERERAREKRTISYGRTDRGSPSRTKQRTKPDDEEEKEVGRHFILSDEQHK